MPSEIHVMTMQNAIDGDEKLSVLATRDMKVTEKSVMTLMSAELEKLDVRHSPHAQMSPVHTAVNVNLVLLVTATTVSMSTNVLTVHVERMLHAQIHLEHTDAHVTGDTKVTKCYVMCYVAYKLLW